MSALRVLVVDDSAAFRVAAHTLLGLDERLDVVGVSASAGEALAFLVDHPVEIVLMDVNMPGVGGIAAAETIRARFHGVVVLLCSSMTAAQLGLADQQQRTPFVVKDEIAADVLVEQWRRGAA